MGPIDLDLAWAELLQRFGDLIIARHRGDPARAQTRRYRTARRAFDAVLATASGGPDRRAVEVVRAVLPWLDEWEPVPRRGPAIRPITPSSREPSAADPSTVLRRRTLRRYAAAAAAIKVDGERIDRLTAFGRLATEPDATTRRRTFEALAPVWQAVDGDGGRHSPYRTLVRASAERWARDGSPIEANAAALGIEPGEVEPMLRSILAAWRPLLGSDPIEPWDYRYRCGAAARQLDRLVPVERLRPLNDAYLASLGADVGSLGIEYDIVPRPGRPVIPVAFTIGRGPILDGSGGWRSRPPAVFATYAEGGLGNLGELLHESGHALHAAAIRARPPYAEHPESQVAFLEATADVLGWDVDEPAWQARWLGEAASAQDAALHRYGSVMLDVCWALFELELHRSPARRPNDVWTETTADGLGIAAHPEWSWWAVRGQLLEVPGYLANYAFSAIVAAAVRARLRELRGDWSAGDPGWYGALADAFFRWGSERTPAELLMSFLGAPVTAEPLLADIGR
jgi:hypothetical protein